MVASVSLVILLIGEFLDRLPDIIAAFEDPESITLEQILPITSAEIEARNARKLAEE